MNTLTSNHVSKALPFNFNLLKLIALTSMVIDHVHFIWFARMWEPVRWMGLIAFPLFCFMVTYNFMHHTSDKWAMLKRFGLFALISQVPYQWALGLPITMPGLNIFVTLGLGLLWLYVLEQKAEAYVKEISIVVGLGLLTFEHLTQQQHAWLFDGGIAGIVLMPAHYLLFQKAPQYKAIGWGMVLWGLYILDNQACVFSMGGIFFAYYLSGFVPLSLGFMRQHKMFFYWFYPAHLFIIRFALTLIPMYIDHILK